MPIDIEQIGGDYQWWLAMQDLANGDARHVAVLLRDPQFGMTAKMRDDLAAHLLAKRKPPRKRPSKLTASQQANLPALLHFENDFIGLLRKKTAWVADQWQVEPKEVLKEAARLRQEHREAWARKLNVSVSTIEKMLKKLKVERARKKSRI